MIPAYNGRNFCVNRVKICVLFLALVTLCSVIPGAEARGEVACRAEVNRTSVPVGGDVILTVTAEGSVDWSAEFNLPQIPGVRIRSGGTNQSMTFINGRSSTTISHTYYLHVEKPENFVIGKISVVSGQNQGESEPIEITVTPADQTAGVPTANSGNRVRQPSSSSGYTTPTAGDDVFVTLEVDHDELWVGQQVILSFKYWNRGQSWSSPSYSAPKTEGFWREDLGQERSYSQRFKGWNYTVTEIRYALFPTRSGTLTIEPAKLEFSGSNGFFFGSRSRTRTPQSFQTDAITLEVKPLPLPRPAEFSGIAGTSLNLSAKINRTEVPVGESVTYSIEMLTDGFLKGFSGLEVEVPQDCRLHDGSEQLETRIDGRRDGSAQRLLGLYRKEKFLVPGSEGLLEIPGQTISWFNVLTGKYQTAQTKVQRVSVTPGVLGAGGAETSGFRRSEIERLGMDLAFIRQVPDKLAMWKPQPLKRPLYWICIALPLLGLASWRIYTNMLATDRRNPANVRRRQALVSALTGLKKSEELAGSEERIGAVTRVITGYVADILNRPVASVGSPEVREFCKSLGLDHHGSRLVNLLLDSASARYGGIDSSAETSTNEVKEMIADLDAAYKKQGKVQGKNALQKVVPVFLLACLSLVSLNPALANDQDDSRPRPDSARLLAEGNQAYTAGDIPLAATLYAQALEYGADDPILHYNLGNAYARQGQLGKAVVSYLRAGRLSPLDKDISGNLRWTRSQLKDLELQDSSLPLFIAEVVTVIGWLTLRQWSFVPLLLVWVLAVLIGWGWYKDEFGYVLRRLIITAVAVLLLSSGITGWRYYLEEVRDQAVIVVAEAAVYSGPADTYPVLFQVHDGLTVNLSEYRDGWVRMGLGGQWQGWVPASSVESVRLAKN